MNEKFQKTIGTRAVIRVDGFYDAKRWIYDMVRAGVAACSEGCGKAAVQVWWNDAAEWYTFCGDHYDPRSQWSGHTRWNPSVFSKNVIREQAEVWLKTLDAKDRANIRLQDYDATDYWSLIEDYTEPEQVVTLETNESGSFRHIVRLWELSCGGWVYERRKEWGRPEDMVHTSHGYDLTGWFETAEAAIEAAKAEAVIE